MFCSLTVILIVYTNAMNDCGWRYSSEAMKVYHDTEWGTPAHDDRLLFEYLFLECMQCGLSWDLMMKKREIFRACFDNYDWKIVMNYTDAETPWTRIIEHKWFQFGKDDEGKELPKTVISREYSQVWKQGDEPYYPVNDEKNTALYEKYRALADREKRVIFGGRLGEYKYYDMDAVIASVLKKCEEEFS